MKSGTAVLLLLALAIAGVIVAVKLGDAPAPALPTPTPTPADPEDIARAELASIQEFQAADTHLVRRDETLRRYALFIERHPTSRWLKTAVELRDGFLAGSSATPGSTPSAAPGVPEADQEIDDLYLQSELRFREAMARRAYAEAASMTRDFLFRAWPERQRARVRVPGADYDAIAAACGHEGDGWDWARLSDLAGKGVGDPATPKDASLAQRLLLDFRNAAELELFRGQVLAGLKRISDGAEVVTLITFTGEKARVKAAGAKIALDFGGGRTTTVDPWTDLRDLDQVQFATRSLDADPGTAKEKAIRDATHLLRSGLYLYYSAAGDTHRGVARVLFSRAAAAGATGARLYGSDLHVDLMKIREEELKAAYERLVSLISTDRWTEAKPLLEELLAATDSPLVLHNRAQIDEMAKSFRDRTREGDALAATYHGRVDVLPSGRLRVTYDFEDKAQLEAFEDIETGAKQRWSHDRGALGSSGDRCAIRWKSRVAGDVEVEWDLAMVEGAQNLSLDLYWHPNADKHYAAVIGLDVAFGKQDPTNELEERFGMPRCCLLKYPLGFTVAGRDWSTAESWKPLQERLVGKGPGAPRPRRDSSLHARVTREGRRLSLAIDGKVAWEGEDSEYGEGFLLFYGDSRARIDNLAITFAR